MSEFEFFVVVEEWIEGEGAGFFKCTVDTFETRDISIGIFQISFLGSGDLIVGEVEGVDEKIILWNIDHVREILSQVGFLMRLKRV